METFRGLETFTELETMLELLVSLLELGSAGVFSTGLEAETWVFGGLGGTTRLDLVWRQRSNTLLKVVKGRNASSNYSSLWRKEKRPNLIRAGGGHKGRLAAHSGPCGHHRGRDRDRNVGVAHVILPGADGGGQVGKSALPSHWGARWRVAGGGGHFNLPLCHAQGGGVWSCITAV